MKFVILDIWECEDGTHNCSQICVEKEGGFSCACFDGFKLLDNGVSCQGMHRCR